MSEPKQTKACEACGAAIVFLHTSRGKWIPIDAETVSPGDEDYEPRSGHVSHWGTCPDAGRFRKA